MAPISVLLAAVLYVTPADQSIGANVAGIVTDASGARVAEATVTVTHPLNGRVLVLKTGREGEYRAVALLPGDYDITATRAGFRPVTQRVALPVGADATVNFSLPLASVAADTTVRAEIPLVEVSRFQPSSVVTQGDIQTLPLLDRNVLVLAQLLPGSGPINGTVNRLATTKFGGPADQRVGYTTLVDGGDINDSAWGSPTINIGEEAVQEFKVFRYQFGVEHGHALTAVVTVATRSGTNRFAGSLLYFGRDDALNARYYFADENLPFEERRLGGTFGGPISRDRSHFFVSYESDDVDTVRLVALSEANPFAKEQNGVFDAEVANRMGSGRLDHRFTTRSLSVRYAFDRQKSLRAGTQVTSDSSQLDIANRSHSLVVEDTWIARQNVVNALRVHVLNHTLGTTPRDSSTAVRRPSVTTGVAMAEAWVLPATRVTLSNALYIHSARSDVTLGGELAFGAHEMDSHIFENGLFVFTVDTPFNRGDPRTWPTEFTQQKPARSRYRSREIGLFVQHDWRLRDRIRINSGLRYDVDLNLRLNDFYAGVLDDPAFSGLDRFISRDRGTDTNNLQPRLGATWDARGDGRFIVRGGWGMYVTRNRPWFQLRAMNQIESTAVRVTGSPLLQFFEEPSLVLEGLGLDGYIARYGGRQIGSVIPDEFVQPYAVNTTAGVTWQVTQATALTVDYVHSYGTHQTGSTDVNLPTGGAVGPNNPRPVPRFSQVTMIENFSRSWYDALESQVRLRLGAQGSLQASYTLSRSYLDGVDFFLNPRGTQRTPHEVGYNPSDQRHNLTVAGTVTLPWALQISGILKLVSGSPIKVQAGQDLDGDASPNGDLPEGVPITVGRERVVESIVAINQFRRSLGRPLKTIGASALRLDPYRTLDLRIARSWPLGGGQRIEALIEGFNVTNRVNLRPPTGPGANMNSPAFLDRTAARDARQIQWGVRYSF